MPAAHTPPCRPSPTSRILCSSESSNSYTLACPLRALSDTASATKTSSRIAVTSLRASSWTSKLSGFCPVSSSSSSSVRGPWFAGNLSSSAWREAGTPSRSHKQSPAKTRRRSGSVKAPAPSRPTPQAQALRLRHMAPSTACSRRLSTGNSVIAAPSERTEIGSRSLSQSARGEIPGQDLSRSLVWEPQIASQLVCLRIRNTTLGHRAAALRPTRRRPRKTSQGQPRFPTAHCPRHRGKCRSQCTARASPRRW